MAYYVDDGDGDTEYEHLLTGKWKNIYFSRLTAARSRFFIRLGRDRS